ncbi:MAG: hypothetical protein ACYC2G_14990, partial [Gemmatimonadaceae bacterium]
MRRPIAVPLLFAAAALLPATLAAQGRNRVPRDSASASAAAAPAAALTTPPAADARIYDIVAAPQPARIEADVRRLAGFGTRNTLSDTLSDSRGIGAARRWIRSEFDRVAAACGGCLEVSYTASVDTVRGGGVVN